MTILEFLENHILLLDGGSGTLLQEAGLRPGEQSEAWNLTHPEEVERIHAAYYEAGSHLVYTNTFGVNALKYDDEMLARLVGAALDCAKRAREKAHGTSERFIACDLGPTGRLLRPYGDLGFEEAVEAFSKVVTEGEKGGADAFVIETMNDSYETKAALLAVKEHSRKPVFVSNAYGADEKLLTGASPEAMAALLCGLGADMIGANCSLGPRELSGVAERLVASSSVPVFMKPNAGLPRCVDGKTVYDVTPEEFAETVAGWVHRGVRAVGGCCGTTPEHIRKLAVLTEGLSPVISDRTLPAVVSSSTHAVTFGSSPILIGERINPTGKKRFREALTNGDIGYVLNEGIRQQECGAAVLDVNVGVPGLDEKTLLPRVVTELQAVSDLPLQIDTTDPSAMENALRLYNGKAMINSVNGKRESMETTFPLVRKYGGLVVALTLDENGIPADAEGRLMIARHILETAKGYGLSERDLIFDPLCLTVSADKTSAMTTLKALRLIKEELGCLTTLGISNVSFGLPSREAINSTFFALALENGLSAAIMNPYAADMRKVYHAFRALHGLDENCADYIDFITNLPATESTPTAPVRVAASESTDGLSALGTAVLRGLKEDAKKQARSLLETTPPLDVIRDHVIPALDTAGRGFEKGSVYLPQLLMSAEAAKEAFDAVKDHMAGQSGGKAAEKGPFVLATVKGDIHDIGKNIVKLLLENYGFDVRDLGRDVPPEVILRAVLETKAPLCGLSALMTTTVPAMEETIALLHKEAPFCRVVVGGAVLTADYAASIGADKYARDAMETVRYAESIVG